jgi:sporulation protein YlmC with PRC-barrel domain
MLRLLSTILDHRVIAQREARPIGKIKEIVFDPAKGKLVAYRLDTKPEYLSTVDVLGYLDDALVVPDQHVLQAEDDLVRVKQLAGNRTGLIGLKVISDKGKRLGSVGDAEIDTDGHFLAKIHVRPGWWQRLFTHALIIPREQIVKLTPDRVVVRYDVRARSAGVEPEIVQ